MRTRALVGITVALSLAAVAAQPGVASASSETTATFTAGGGGLTIVAAASADIGTGTIGGLVSRPLGTVTVKDLRGVTPAPWTASVASTSFTTGRGGRTETISNENLAYWSGPATATAGAGAVTAGQLTALKAITLDEVRTAFRHSGGGGGNSASWNPTLTVVVPGTIVVGAYSGTITHSVA